MPELSAYFILVFSSQNIDSIDLYTENITLFLE